MHRQKVEYESTQEILTLLGGFMGQEEDCYLMVEFGMGVRVEVQYSRLFGLAARTVTRKWSECWDTNRTVEDIGELLDEAHRFLPLMEGHVRSHLNQGWDLHSEDPLYFARR